MLIQNQFISRLFKRHVLARLVVAWSITSSECSVRVAAEWFINIQVSSTVIRHRGPVLPTVGRVDGDPDVVTTIGFEVFVISQPSSHLSTNRKEFIRSNQWESSIYSNQPIGNQIATDLTTEIVSNSLRLFGVDQVLVTRVQGLRLELCHLKQDFTFLQSHLHKHRVIISNHQ